jgi:hypothetical protein
LARGSTSQQHDWLRVCIEMHSEVLGSRKPLFRSRRLSTELCIWWAQSACTYNRFSTKSENRISFSFLFSISSKLESDIRTSSLSFRFHFCFPIIHLYSCTHSKNGIRCFGSPNEMSNSIFPISCHPGCMASVRGQNVHFVTSTVVWSFSRSFGLIS